MATAIPAMFPQRFSGVRSRYIRRGLNTSTGRPFADTGFIRELEVMQGRRPIALNKGRPPHKTGVCP